MSKGLRTSGSVERGTQGQALIEMSFVILMLVFTTFWIAEVGFDFMRVNLVVHAARDGARFGATLASRDADTGCFAGTAVSDIKSHVATALAGTGTGFSADDVTVSQTCDNAVPIIEVTISGPMDPLFNFIFSEPFTVARTV